MNEQPIKLYNLTDNTSYKLKINNMSEKYSLNKQDLLKVLTNAGIFLAPALLVFLLAVQSGVSVKEALNLVYLWALNTAIDLLRKFTAGRK